MNQPRSHARVRELGQGLVEYALIIGLVAIALIAALALLAPSIGSVFDRIGTGL